MRVLIDGDPLVYRAGFSAQNNWKILRWVDVVDEDDFLADEEHEAFFAYVWEMEDFIYENCLHPDEYEVTTWVDPLSEAYCLKIVKDNVKNIIGAVNGYLAEDGRRVEEVTVYLSGHTNFRNNVVTIPGRTDKETGELVVGYKSNRKHSERPYWYDRIRQYLCEQWDAVIVEGIEADDALAIAQWAEDEYDPKTIIATIDKDLQNVPGWHYNILKKKDNFVTFKQAKVFFYRQLLTGDATDTIPGCYRVGPGMAAKLITEDMSEEEMYEACLKKYDENVAKYPQRYSKPVLDAGNEEAGRVALIENARLLWMLQHEDQAWTPPGEPDGSLEELGFKDFGEWDD